MKPSHTTIETIIDFWFSDTIKQQWFSSTPALDAAICQRFETTWIAARDGQLGAWEKSPSGALALCILLDQFPLNMYRNQALSFSTEYHAIQVAKRAIIAGHHLQLASEQVVFLYMPFMHSESLADQDLSIAAFSALGNADNLYFAQHHHDIIQRFGRFPHRNPLLKRTDTEAERLYLQSDQAFHG